MSENEKRCWMCRRTAKEVAEEYDLKEADNKPFELDEHGEPVGFTWWHDVCVVCADIIKAVGSEMGYLYADDYSLKDVRLTFHKENIEEVKE